MIEWSIRAGDVMVLLGFLGGSLALVFRGGKLYAAIEVMQNEIRSLKEVAAQIGSVLTTVAVQKVEIEHIRKDISDLRRGNGWITRARDTVEGEYPQP